MNPTRESYAQIVRDLATLRASVSMAFESDEAEYECSAVMTEAEVLEFEKGACGAAAGGVPGVSQVRAAG